MTIKELKRAAIEHKSGKPMKQIAEDLGVHPNTLWHGLKNSGFDYKSNHRTKHKKKPIEECTAKYYKLAYQRGKMETLAEILGFIADSEDIASLKGKMEVQYGEIQM